MNVLLDHKTQLKPFVAGSVTAATSLLWIPFDNAIFTMNRENDLGKVSIFNTRLWRSPYRGVSQTIYGRLIGSGINLPLYDFYKNLFEPYNQYASFFSGIATSVNTASATHWVNTVKFWQCNKNASGSLFSHIKTMRSQYGLKVFFRGIHYTCARDALFAGTFFPLSEKYNQEKCFYKEMMIAAFSTALSTPINYARIEIFFDFDKKPKTLKELFCKLRGELKELPTLSNKINHLLFTRFCFGYGIARASVGMALARKVYDEVMQRIE